MGLRWLDAGLFGGADEFGAGAEYGHPKLVEQIKERRRARVEWAAIIEHDRGSGGESRDQPIPHHPTAGGEVKETVSAP